ncbi:MAG: BON domain-containing protein [Candidatus Omnitrophica bacterium]|nr:BON domain-containing protein [Candidatus Omnitrophota bacterium]
MRSKIWSYMVIAAVLLFVGGISNVCAMTTDESIEESAKNSYVFRNYLKDDDVKADSKDGIVYLTGTVSDKSKKDLAQELVSELPGVKKVDNQIVVQGEDYPEHSDGWLALKAKSALLFRHNVSGMNTHVEVKDGTAILTGKADSQGQKDLTGEIVRGVEGIKAVNNDITVEIPVQKVKEEMAEEMQDAKEDMKDKVDAMKDNENRPDWREKIDDASITAQVKLALLWNGSTSGLKTDVDTADGVVTLKGEAKNSAEIDLANKLANDINGVRRVDNQMVVLP